MNISINNSYSFKGKLKTTIKTEDKARLKNIGNIYQKLTNGFPEPLYLTQTKEGGMSFHVSNVKDGDFYAGTEIFSDSLNQHLDKMSDFDFAQKCTDFFKIIRLSDKANSVVNEIKSITSRLQYYKNLADSCRASGNTKFADRYDVIANMNSKKLQSLNMQYNNIKEQFHIQQTKSGQSQPEVMQVSIAKI